MNVFESLRELADTVREHAPAALDELRTLARNVDRIASALERANEQRDRTYDDVTELVTSMSESLDEERRS